LIMEAKIKKNHSALSYIKTETYSTINLSNVCYLYY
jgi:hypothetical protein